MWQWGVALSVFTGCTSWITVIYDFITGMGVTAFVLRFDDVQIEFIAR